MADGVLQSGLIAERSRIIDLPRDVSRGKRLLHLKTVVDMHHVLLNRGSKVARMGPNRGGKSGVISIGEGPTPRHSPRNGRRVPEEYRGLHRIETRVSPHRTLDLGVQVHTHGAVVGQQPDPLDQGRVADDKTALARRSPGLGRIGRDRGENTRRTWRISPYGLGGVIEYRDTQGRGLGAIAEQMHWNHGSGARGQGRCGGIEIQEAPIIDVDDDRCRTNRTHRSRRREERQSRHYHLGSSADPEGLEPEDERVGPATDPHRRLSAEPTGGEPLDLGEHRPTDVATLSQHLEHPRLDVGGDLSMAGGDVDECDGLQARSLLETTSTVSPWSTPIQAAA